ncbi:MAG: tyrosine-type recombinase/integrase [Zavarzinella sp.]
MARTAKPWYRQDRKAWFVNIRGKRHNLGPNKKAAFKLFHELMLKSEESQPLPAKTISIAMVFDKFLEWCQLNRSRATYVAYRYYQQSFLDSLGATCLQPADSLRPFHVLDWVQKHPDWGKAHQRGAMQAIQRAYNWGEQFGYLQNNPVKWMKKPQAPRRENPLSAPEYNRILEQVQDLPFRQLLLFAWETGCRPNELFILESRHINLELSRVEIPPAEAKGKKKWRFIYLTEAAKQLIEELLQKYPDGKLFRNTFGKPWTRLAVNGRFCRLKKATGIAYCMYDFRHGFCQRLLESGVDHVTVAALMGHTDARMVACTYSHMNQADSHLRTTLDQVSKKESL